LRPTCGAQAASCGADGFLNLKILVVAGAVLVVVALVMALLDAVT
jgi:hypothetical protein